MPDAGAVASAADGWGDDDVTNDGDWDDWGDEGHGTGTAGQGNGHRRERASQERVGHFQRQIKVRETDGDESCTDIRIIG